MSNRNIFMDMGADTEVELHLKSNAMSFSKLFGDGEKIKSEYLPENAGGGNVDLGALVERVTALEHAPKGEGGGNSLGVYDKSVYTKVVNESELLSQLTSEQLSGYKRLKRICRAAFCWRKLSGIESGQDTAVKIVLEDGTVFLRLNDGKMERGVSGMFDVHTASFYNVSELKKVDFIRYGIMAEFANPGSEIPYKYAVAQVESDQDYDYSTADLIAGRFVGRWFTLGDANYTIENPFSTEDLATTASNAKTTADNAKTTADTAKTTADTAKTTADTAKTTADGAKESVENLKHTVDSLTSTVEPYSGYFAEHASDIRRLEKLVNDAMAEVGKLREELSRR